MTEDDPRKNHEQAIWLRLEPDAPSALSKLGGLPNLPETVEWPRQEEAETPLHFLAQIALSELPATPLAPGLPALPHSGFLFFFADIDEEMLWGEQASPQASTRVIHTDEAGPEREPPSDLPELFHAFGEERGDQETGMRVYPQAPLKAYVLDSFEDPGISGDKADREDFEVALTASIERALGTPLPVRPWTAAGTPEPREYLQEIRSCEHRNLECPIHQMFGFGKNVQGTAAEARDNGDILLLQLDSDLDLHEHFMFCDVGVAQFWIRPEDLAAKRFEKAWATTEGG